MSGLNKLKTKVTDLDVDKWKTTPVDLKELSDVVSKKVVKNTKFNKLNSKVSNLENKIPNASTLIQTNQYNASKQNLKKKDGDVDNKTPVVSDLMTTTFLNAKTGKAEDKIPDAIGIVTTNFFNTKIGEVENEIPNHNKYITTSEFNTFTSKIYDMKLKQANLAVDSDQNAVLQRGNKDKEKMEKLQKFDLSHFLSCFFCLFVFFGTDGF